MMTGSPHLKATGKILGKNNSPKAAAESSRLGSTPGHRTHKSCTDCSLDTAAGSFGCKKGTETGSADDSDWTSEPQVKEDGWVASLEREGVWEVP